MIGVNIQNIKGVPHSRRAIVNRASVSAIRLLSLTHCLGDTSGAFLCGGNNGCAVVSGYRLAVSVAEEEQFSKGFRLGRLCGGLFGKRKAELRSPNIGYCTRLRTL